MYNKRLIFWSACLGMLSFGIVFISLGSIAPDLREKLILNEVEAGTLFSILPFGVLLGSLVFGPVIDRFGYRILLLASCIFMFTGFEGIAFASSKGIIKLWIFFIGLGGGAINGATNALVSDISERNKGANLSLLGVFYGIGALGTPLLLGLLREIFTFETVFMVIGGFICLTAIFFLLLRFPSPKQSQGLPLKQSASLIKDRVLWLVAVFLFFQSGFEGIVNNWTTLFLTDHMAFNESKALYGLTIFVAGMMVMRLLLGSIFRSSTSTNIMTASFILLITGLIVIKTGGSFFITMSGLFILGSGLGGGFPIMLGIVGERFSKMSGTAFSFALVIALVGNTLINYAMGLIAENFGVRHLTTVAFIEVTAMIVLFFFLMIKITKDKKQLKTD
ncbi:MAG: MFS transporter [Bacteroidales bacterium]|nr:MFS transporter [Bacteroidales bacterium]